MTSIEEAVGALSPGPLTEEGLRRHIWPLFSRVLARKEIYLANHSLGRPLDQTAEDVREGLDHWYARMDDSWDFWAQEMDAFRERIALLIGIGSGRCIAPKTSAGQGLRAVLNALPRDGLLRPLRIVATRGEFDSLDFILKAYVAKGRAEVRWVEPSAKEGGVPLFESSRIAEAISPGTDLAVVSQAMFTTGQVLRDVERVVEAAHRAGAFALVDIYHALGVVPVDMAACDADFMVGGSYKYARGGPGACWLAVHPRVLESGLRTLDTGWFAKKNRFGYERSDEAEFDDAWLESTPPVLTAYQSRAGQQLLLAMGVDRLRAYSLDQQQMMRRALREKGVPVFDPADAAGFGAFSLVPSDSPKEFSKRLLAQGVVTDARGPFVRFGPDILTSSEEIEEAARIVGTCLQSALA
jgi:kynureninase